eukprot:4986509-Pyramimonas_sp.AAC.1
MWRNVKHAAACQGARAPGRFQAATDGGAREMRIEGKWCRSLGGAPSSAGSRADCAEEKVDDKGRPSWGR